MQWRSSVPRTTLLVGAQTLLQLAVFLCFRTDATMSDRAAY
jgi:hypothetical protein